jgi:N6-L-threonylcarbamoyladenine synthase
MLILGIDTSCDDTSASVVEDGSKILSNIVSSQIDIHRKYGGIVPELASRRHIEMIIPVVDGALKKAEISIKDLSAVSVCYGPGLIGSLLVGCSFAKALCCSKDIPLVAVNHLEGHILSAFLENPDLKFPFLSLVVSGGHTSLYSAEDFGRYSELGRTRDDAAGEAYDKVSKLLGLGYPGGPVIDSLAKKGNPVAIDFPRAYLPENLDFSFSGLKTSVLHYLRAEARKPACRTGRHGSAEAVTIKTSELPHYCTSALVNDIAASFQSSVVDVLVKKTEWAIKQQGVGRVTISGGVAANSELRNRMKAMGEKQTVEVYFPSAGLCTDNAAMIAAAGYHRFLKKEFAGPGLNPQAYLPL